MEKMSGKSMSIIDNNFDRIKELFPIAVTEGKIDFEVLRTLLGDEVDDSREKYQFVWHGKAMSVKASQSPSVSTLRPCFDKSKNWDDTKNIYIEGDNLEVLKLLQKTYYNRIKIIYIDPPYNTGNDFVYKDDYSNPISNYLHQTAQESSSNPESSGRYHTDWLNLIYPRLILARNLLEKSGVIFISIGQNELSNMISLGNEVFGESNKIGIVSRLMKSGGAKGRFFSPNVEYILIYAKNIEYAGSFREPLSEEIIRKLYTSVETEGERKGEKYRPFGLYQSSLDARPNQRYYIECPDGELVIPPGETMPEIAADGEMVVPKKSDGCWRWSKERYIQEKEKGNLDFKKSSGVLINSNGQPASWNIYTKIWLSDRQEEGAVPVDLITKWENRQSKKELQELNIPFDFAKPVELIQYLISLVENNKDAIVLDFFSGSATTAHAVMKLNSEDNGSRQFIMVQLPESCSPDSDAYKAGFKTICDIGEARIDRAGDKLIKDWNAEHKALPLVDDNIEPDVDIGMKVFMLDSTNINSWDNYSEYDENTIYNTATIFKPDRTKEDILYEVMLKYGVFEQNVTQVNFQGKTLYKVGLRHMVVCLEDNITNDVIDEICKMKPGIVVFKEDGFKDDNAKINAEYNLKNAGVEDVKCI